MNHHPPTHPPSPPLPQGESPEAGNGENLIMEPTWGKAEGEDTKLVEAASPAEVKELPDLRMDEDVEVGVPQIYGCRPVPSANGMAYILRRLHAEMGSVQVRRVETLEVDDRMHTLILLLDKEDVADETGGRV
jgi:hypothetical protein